MASSSFTNAYLVDFESVLEIPDQEGMQKMFKALENSGLRGFLGCKPVLFLSEIVQFFETALVQDNDITGAISGKYFTITPSLFAGVFELPTEGISNFSDVPKNQVCDARCIFSLSGTHVYTHGKKKFLKNEYRLLNDILAKSITVKACSFDAVTNESFQMMTVIHFGLKVNWGKVFFSVLKEMVDRSVKKAKGFGAQISVLLNSDPVLSMGNATPIPASKILSPKVVLTYITANETADARGQSEEGGKSPVAVVKRASKSKKKLESSSDAPVEIVFETVGSKKRPAVVGEEPVIAKKKRTSKGKPPSSQASPISIAQGAVPFQMIEPTIAAPVEKPPASKRQSNRRILVLPTVSEDEDEEDAVEGTIDKVSHVPAQVTPIMDVVDMIIGQVIFEYAGLSTNKTEQGDKHVDETDIGDDFDKWLDSSFPDFDSRVDEPVVASTNLEKAVSSTPNVEEADDSQSMDIQGTVEQTGGSTSKDVGEIVAPAASSKKSAEEHMSFDDILLQISNDMLLPSITAAEVTMIRLGEFSSIGDKGKAILVEDEQITVNPASEIVALICRDVEVLVRVRDSVMKAVVDFFASFSLNTMPDMESLKDLKEKEKLMMEWAETNTLATAVRRQMYVLTNYREILLRTFFESYRRYLAPDQPWTDMAVQVISLLSAAHSQSLEDFKAQQQEHKIEMVQPNSSLPVIASIDHSGVRLAHFYSIAKSICWVRPMVLIDEVWAPLQGSSYWRSNCKLSLFVDRKRLPESVVAENFDSQISLIEPARYWGAAPLLIKIWAWQRICTEAIQFSVSGRLRPASFSSDIVIGNFGVERLPDYFLDDFEQGVNTDYFVEFLSGSSGQSGSEFDSASSSGDTVYRSPSPPDYAYALGPPILSPTVQEERLYFLQSPDSSPAASPQQESSSSSSSDVSLHFDSADLPVHDHAKTQESAPVDSNVFTNALEDLRSSISQRIHESTYEILSKVNDVEFSVRGDLLKQQAWLRQTFQNACEVLERQSTQMNDLKKGLTAPVGRIFQDLFDIKKNQRAQEAKLNALDGHVAAIRNEQLEFQNKI
ncbi:hypothetical protein F511_14144 [Dorcoceras hygrometricum]|uniref:Dystroglycan-like n=1 Tax=Dorcoceras hygrometricum TaxID=472368 RepID=A0A2Z7CWC3_9LAMI|nr:hypothetical protein F511_14144 [Dorcoceras hygrometricum]